MFLTLMNVGPTSRSATAKLMSRKEVRLSSLRCFQNTDIEKVLLVVMIKDSTKRRDKDTITVL